MSLYQRWPVWVLEGHKISSWLCSKSKGLSEGPYHVTFCFWLLPGLMLGRAGPVSSSTTDLLVKLGKQFTFPVPLSSHLPCLFVTPWQGQIYWTLICCWEDWNSSCFILFQSHNELSKPSKYKGHQALVPTGALMVIPSVALAKLTLYFDFLYL